MRSATTELDTPFFFRSREAWTDPWPAYRRLRDETPVLAVTQEDDVDFWVLSRFADVFDAARDTATFSSAQGLIPSADAMAMFEDRAAPIVMMDPPDHTAMRRLVSRPMTPRRVALIEDAVRDFVDERLDGLAAAGGGDVIAALFKPLPSFVVAHYLGVPVGDRERFDAWTQEIVVANAESDITGGLDAALELFEYASDLIELRRSEPGDDLVSDLVAVGDELATPEWIIGFVFTMVTGGNDTMTGMLGGAAELLTTNPAQRRILLDEPERIGPSVDEFLRLTSPVQNLARTTTRPVVLRDVEIPEGAQGPPLLRRRQPGRSRVRPHGGRARRPPAHREDPELRLRPPPLPGRGGRPPPGPGGHRAATGSLPRLLGRSGRRPFRGRADRPSLRVPAPSADVIGAVHSDPAGSAPTRDSSRYGESGSGVILVRMCTGSSTFLVLRRAPMLSTSTKTENAIAA